MKDYMNYSGKVCVVTGSASGMGKATSEMLVELGARVYALDYNTTEMSGIEKYIQVDLSKKASIDAAFAQIPETIDSFFGCAGVDGERTPFVTTVIINFLSNKYITEEYLSKRMKAGSAISYVGSVVASGWERKENIAEYIDTVRAGNWDETVNQLEATGLEGNNSGNDAYAYSKMALCYYATDVSDMFAKEKIRVNFIQPSSCNTGMAAQFIAQWGNNDKEYFEKYMTGNAGRLAEPVEMAAALVFLCSDMASFITGVGMDVNYGATVQEVLGNADSSYRVRKFKRA